MHRIFVLIAAVAVLLASAAQAAKRLPKDMTTQALVALAKQAGGDLTNVEESFGVFKGKVGAIGFQMVASESGEKLDVLLKEDIDSGSMNCADKTYKTSIVERRTLDGPSIVWWQSTACQPLRGGTLVTQGVIIVDNDRNQKFTLVSGEKDKVSALAKGLFDALVKAHQ